MESFIPSDDWELNILMLRIARELGDDDFQSMKFLCSGQKGIPKGVLEKLTTPQKFFTYLREQKMLSRDNLLLLQSFLYHTERQDLHQLATEYAQKVGDVLHFFTPDVNPDGFEHVKFHVEGTLDTFQRRELEDLRANVARLLFVPPEFVFVSGLEPANSLFVTFMMHTHCAKRLKDVAQTPQGNLLEQIGVDVLYFQEEEVFVHGLVAVSRKASIQEEEIAQMFKRTQELEVKVVAMDVKAIEDLEQHEKLDREMTDIRARETYFRGLLCEALKNKTSPSNDQSVPLCLENGRFVI